MSDDEEIIQSQMQEILAELMSVERNSILPTKTFYELGLDSFLGLRFARKLEDKFSIKIDLEWVYDYPTLQQFSMFLLRILKERGIVTRDLQSK